MDRRFARACVAGAVVAGVVFAWVLFIGRAELAAPRFAADFYDAQARALLDGRWEVPPEVLSFEAFEVGNKSFTYFGPVPALLRMPVLAVTDSLDGRLTQLSMLAAFAVSMLGVSQLSWSIRALVRGEVEVHRREAAITGLFVFGIGAGSVVLYLASQAVVYHEAILWGVAWSLLAYRALLSFLVHPRSRALAWASLFASLAFLTRASVGLGPVLALGLAFVAVGLARVRASDDRVPSAVRWSAPGIVRRPPTRLLVAAMAAVLVPVGLYVAVNEMKFGELYRLPLEKQVYSDLDPDRRAALADNDGSLFGLKFVPTTAWQALRPDAIDLDSAAPWINFPRSPPDVIGGVTFDTLDESSSVTSTMPLLVVLALVGLVTVSRGRPSAKVMAAEDDHTIDAAVAVGAVRLPTVGALAGFVTVLTIAFIAHRYLGDAIPPLLLLALVGLHTCGRSFGGDLTKRAVAVGVVLVALGVWGVVANVGLAVEYQRLIAPADVETRYAFVGFQDAAPGQPPVTRVDGVPVVGERGELAVVGDCDALLWSDGHDWYLLEGDLDTAVDDREVPPVITDGARSSSALCRALTP